MINHSTFLSSFNNPSTIYILKGYNFASRCVLVDMLDVVFTFRNNVFFVCWEISNRMYTNSGDPLFIQLCQAG